MPDIITHYRLGQAAFQLLAPDLQASILSDVYDHATAGPDIWFSYRFWQPKAQEGRPERGNIMQHHDTGAFLLALARRIPKGEAGNPLFSYLSGFLCHYCLDRAAHPYIIYRSGEYDGTEATRSARGNHTRLERALDLRELQKWGLRIAKSPILRKILRLRRLPSTIQLGLDGAYREVYGWDHAYDELNTGLKDQRLFYFLAQDPTGILDALLRLIDRGKSHHDLTAMTYHGREQPEVDIANTTHQPWLHPFDPTLRSEQSFDELFDTAARDASAMIGAVWAYQSLGDDDALAAAIGNASYETGFPCDDPRNDAQPQCSPLPLSKHTKRKD